MAGVDYELGSIQVTAELQDGQAEEIATLQAVIDKYEFLRERPKEHFYAVFLKSDNEVIGDKLVGLGGTGQAPSDLKDIARTAALTNASAVILVHNHPSTNSQATPRDKEATQEIKEGLKLLGVDLLDHVIISQTGHHSMKHSGEI